MSGIAWFVYPVRNGVELVIDGTSDDVYEAALADFVTQYPDMNLAAEWPVGGGEVMHFVPTPDAVPAPRVWSADEMRSRAAHPAGKGRRMPEQRWEL
jgi:hypothetical protein